MSSRQCRICDATEGHTEHVASELMFGSLERFAYFECGRCGCVQIAEVPTDLAEHYPPTYYSMSAVPRTGGLRGYLKRQRLLCAMGRPRLLGAASRMLRASPPHHRWILATGIALGSPLLDVGCGRGELLYTLREEGFTNLTGIDPFLSGPEVDIQGLRIMRSNLRNLRGAFRLVMFHHSLEHMPNQLEAIESARRLLEPNGTALVRIPLAGTYAWRTYGPKWVQWDAPRHLFLHTRSSMTCLAKRANLEVERVEFDSTAFQFWASDWYQSGKSLAMDERGSLVTPTVAGLGCSDLRVLEDRAAELNRNEDGDQATFYLRPVKGR